MKIEARYGLAELSAGPDYYLVQWYKVNEKKLFAYVKKT